jgi:hypothetical protein
MFRKPTRHFYLRRALGGFLHLGETVISNGVSHLKNGDGAETSFEFCNTALAKVDESNLSDEVVLFGGHIGTRAFALIAFTNDWAGHHSSAAMYLRSNGVLPPAAQPKK